MNLRDHLFTLEEELLSPSTRHDAARLTHLLAPDFLEFGSSGRTFTRDQIIADLLSETPETDLRLTDFTLRHSTPHTDPEFALVTYRSTRTTASSAARSSLRSSTWVCREGRWQLLFHQGTPEPQEAAPEHTRAVS